jgi:hypothetical protein
MRQITDQEENYGIFYYNGSRAWVTVSYAPYKGTHYCVVNYAVGYTIARTTALTAAAPASALSR